MSNGQKVLNPGAAQHHVRNLNVSKPSGLSAFRGTLGTGPSPRWLARQVAFGLLGLGTMP